VGGTGSGRWTSHDKKRTVDECWEIGISEVARLVDLSNSRLTSGTLWSIKPTRGERTLPVRIRVKVGDNGKPLLRLSYTVSGRWDLEHWVEEVVRLQTTQPNFGGVRWWFSCTRMLEGEKCVRRVGKLYRPPGGRYFACRHCLDPTYESCQKSHRYDGLLALVAGEASGESFEAVKRAFSYRAKEAKRRREESAPTLLDAFEAVSGETEALYFSLKPSSSCCRVPVSSGPSA